jgi:Ca2+-binding EF-hand superfamily protein
MLNQNESSSDLSTGNIDENPNIRVKPSIQASVLNNFKLPERKKSQNFSQRDSSLKGRPLPRKNSSASKFIRNKNLIQNKNEGSKRISEEKTRKLFNFREKQEGKNNRKANDDEKFRTGPRLITEKRGIQSFLKQLQTNCKDLKSRVLPGPVIRKKDSFDNADNQALINKRSSKSPQAIKESPKKGSPSKSPNFSFQPLKQSSSSSRNLLKNSSSSKSPSSTRLKTFSSPKSEQLLIKKFENEFLKLVNDIDFDSSGLLNYSKFCQVLQKMNFISSTIEKTDEERELLLKAWKMLGGSESGKISKKNLCNFLLAVSNIVKKTRASSNDTAISGMKNGTLFINVDDVKRIHRDFQLLHQNRQSPRVRPESTVKTPQKMMVRPGASEKKDLGNHLEVPEFNLESDLMSNEKIFKTSPGKMVFSPEQKNLTENEVSLNCLEKNHNSRIFQQDEGFNTHFRPTLSIPKVAHQKSTSLRSISCSPENFLQRVKFTFHSNSPTLMKNAGNNSVYTSESEGTENSSINPLVTPPSYASKAIRFHEPPVEVLQDKSAKRYKCQSPDSYEESEESILVTVVLPNEQEQFIRIHREDDLNGVIKDFGRRNNLEIDQLITLKQEIMQKLK